MNSHTSGGSVFMWAGVLVVVLALGEAIFPQSGTDGFASVDQRGKGSPEMTSGASYRHDTSQPLRSMRQVPLSEIADTDTPHEANKNPKINLWHINAYDPVVQGNFFESLLEATMPSPNLNFDGIGYPGVVCNCAPPDTDGEVGATQYVQIVNKGYQVFDKGTGASVLGPASIVSLWSGFGGVCQTSGLGDPVVIYDQLAGRWVLSQFAGTGGTPTDECIAISKSSDATDAYYRYGFHLGSNYFDYPKISVWPDGYYMSMDVFDASGNNFLGPQPYAFDRAKMLTGQSATFVSTAAPLASTVESFKPADLDGSTPPPGGAPNTFVGFPSGGSYALYHFHADFGTPANSTFTPLPTVPAAAFTELCASTRSCVPQLGTVSRLDGLGDRLMHRLAYRNFGDHESLVGNYSVSVGGTSAIRWFELRNVTTGPAAVFQESTYQPDSTWRWLGSAAMDAIGDMAIGYSASSSSINPQIRYAGRLKSDPLSVLAQGETTMFSGTGSQVGSSNRWGDYSALSVDPTDDCTFWYTEEYYSTTTSFAWRTRIASFKFPTCTAGPSGTFHFSITDCSTNTAVAGAMVSIDGNSVGQTATDGALDVTLATGSHAYSISINGYGTVTGNAAISQNAATPLSLCLTAVPVIAAAGPATVATDSGGNGKADPGELVTVNIPLINNGLAATNNLTATLQFGGGVTFISGANPQSYGALGAGGGTATRQFSFQVDQALTCGANIPMSFTLDDGGSNLGTVVFTLPTGTQQTTTPLTQNFDGIVAPALPPNWVASNATGTTLWATSTTAPDSAPNDAFVDDPASLSDKRLESPAFILPSGAAQVSFRNNYNLESTFDGGVLEVSSPNINGGTYTDITDPAVGGSFVSGGYNSMISALHSNPIAGRRAWSGTSGGYLTTVADLGPNVLGQTIRLRFRMGSDNSTAGTGWRVDTLTVTAQQPFCQSQVLTAAHALVAGRVLTADGAGLRNAIVSIQDRRGSVRTTITGAFGYYHFDDLSLGTYIVGAASRHYTYGKRLVNLNDNLTAVDLTPLQQ